MALQSAGLILWPDPNRLILPTSISTNANFQINAGGQRLAQVFEVPLTGTITKVGIRIHTCASVVLSRLGIYTVDASGNPTSTGYGSSGYATFTPAANTYSEVTLSPSATATAGDTAAIVVEFDSTGGDMFGSAGAGSCWLYGLPFPAKFASSTWTKNTGGQALFAHIYYSDNGGQWPDIGAIPFAGATATGTVNINSGGADEYALKITPPFTCRCVGIYHMFGQAAGADYEAILYSGTTALKTATIDGDLIGSSTGVKICRFAGETLTAGQTYRAAIRPTATANLTYRNYTLYAAGVEQSLGVPQGTCQSTRLNQGAWSDSTTTFPQIGIIIDQLDDGVSTGGGGTSGGFLARGPASIIQMIE
jgi:hypothetical protein